MKIAYAIHQGPGEDEGRVIVVTESERGFRVVPDYDCSPKDRRPGIVSRLNERLGVTEKEASLLVGRSMLVWKR